MLRITAQLLSALRPEARDRILNETQELMAAAQENYDFVDHAERLAQAEENEIVMNMAAVLGMPMLMRIIVDLPCRHLSTRGDCGICGTQLSLDT